MSRYITNETIYRGKEREQDDKGEAVVCDDLLFSHAFNCSPESQSGCDRLGRLGTEMLAQPARTIKLPTHGSILPVYEIIPFTYRHMLCALPMFVCVCATSVKCFSSFSALAVSFPSTKLNDRKR